MMVKILTHKARLEQITKRLWKTLDNQLVELSDGRLLYLPKFELTDNNSNPFGDNDLSDVRASHFHDFFCYYHKAIFLKLTAKKLRQEGFLRNHLCDSDGEEINICEDVPPKYFDIEEISFHTANEIFGEILIASGTEKGLAKLMVMAVNCNLGWLKDSIKWRIKGEPQINIQSFYKHSYPEFLGV